MSNQDNTTSLPDREVPESNQISLELYLTPQEAYAMWQADPEKVHILDVRRFEEYTFVGHLEMVRNVPLPAMEHP